MERQEVKEELVGMLNEALGNEHKDFNTGEQLYSVHRLYSKQEIDEMLAFLQAIQ